MENTEENSEKIWKLWKKDKLNSDKIWKIRKKPKLNSEKIGKIWKKIVKWYGKYRRKLWNDMENMVENSEKWKDGKYGRKVSWNVKWYGKYGRKVSWNVKWYGKYGGKASWNVKWYGK